VKYSLYSNVTATLRGDANPKPRNFRAVAPIDVVGRLLINVGPSIPDNSGVNTLFLNECGIWNHTAFHGKLRDIPGLPRERAAELASEYHDVICCELPLIYNMLRQYLALTTDLSGIDPTNHYYNDGHVAATYAEVAGVTATQRGYLTVDDGDLIAWTRRDDVGNMINFRGMNGIDAMVYASALSQQTGVNGIPLLASSPRLTDNVSFMVVPSGNDDDWHDVKKVRNALMKFVNAGRCFNAFDTALHMLSQTACHFRSPVAEGVPLAATQFELVLPAFTTCRFAMPFGLEGDMAGVRPSARACYSAWLLMADGFWMYAALLRAAAEFRGLVTHGTDFDSDDVVAAAAHHAGASGNLGLWLAHASSGLGKRLFCPITNDLGVGQATLDSVVLFDVVGPLVGYNILTSFDVDGARRVQLATWGDYRRQAYHPHLLFALGVLPESKVGRIERSGSICVHPATRSTDICAIEGRQIGLYMMIARSFGWDVTIEYARGSYINSWADNESRMPWTSGELLRTGTALYYVTDANRRTSMKDDFRWHPGMAGNMTFDFSIRDVGVLYDYDRPILLGSPLAAVRLENKPNRPMTGTGEAYVAEIVLDMPAITSRLSDFAMVPSIMPIPADPAPPQPAPPPVIPILEDDPGPPDDDPPEGTSLHAGQ
jgi:hypothetical protein